jgi:hypothetical protein
LPCISGALDKLDLFSHALLPTLNEIDQYGYQPNQKADDPQYDPSGKTFAGRKSSRNPPTSPCRGLGPSTIGSGRLLLKPAQGPKQ